jgi:hypothetical protein
LASGNSASVELYLQPMLVPGTSANAIWNALRHHPSLSDWRRWKAAMFDKVEYVWDLHGIDKASGNVRLEALKANLGGYQALRGRRNVQFVSGLVLIGFSLVSVWCLSGVPLAHPRETKLKPIRNQSELLARRPQRRSII